MSDTLVRLTAALSDRYRLDRELGAGGMATVYLAHDLKHDRDVAIKVLHPDLGAALGSERFLSEIRTTARLQHPHILPLLDSGAADGLLYYVMPLVTGETLRARLERERQLPIPEAVRIAREVASALDYAHRQGVIHRDIKPENILLHDGSAIVADFGIALAVQSAGGARMTQTGLSLGTPQYMSPEQAMGERTIDARSDVYALGAMTYEMLAGDAPFTGGSVQAIVAKVLTEKPTPLRTLRDTVPAHVEQAVFTALAKLPADRYASAAEFAAALAHTGAVTAAVASSITPPARPLVRDPRSWVTAVAVVTSLALVATYIARPAPVAGTEVRQQATYSGRAANPAISPDGRFLAYLERRCPLVRAGSGCAHLMVVEVGGTRPVEVVSGVDRLSGPRWTHDGLSLVFGGALAAGQSGLFVVPRLGGIPRRVADEPVAYDTHATADSVARVIRRGDSLVVDVLDLVSGRSNAAQIAVSHTLQGLAWSPGGQTFAVTTADSLFLTDRDGQTRSAALPNMRTPVRWSVSGNSILGFQWTEGVYDNLVALDIEGDGHIAAPRQLVSQVPTLLQGEFDVARSTGRIVVGSGTESSDIWSFDLTTAGSRATRLTHGTNWHGDPVPTADGSAVYYLRADQLGNSLYRIIDGRETALTAERQLVNNSLRFSLDNRTITFESQVDSSSVLMLYDIASGTTRRIPRGKADLGWLLPGGARLVWISLGGGRVWTTDSVGRDRRNMAAFAGQTSASGDWGLSPSGGAIVVAGVTLDATVITIVPLDGRPATRLARYPLQDGEVGVTTWASDGTIYLARTTDDEGTSTTIVALDAASGATRPGFMLPMACNPTTTSYAPAARRAACLVPDRRRDLTLIDGIRP